MTDKERAAQFIALYLQIEELMTTDEINTYPVLVHFRDLIDDLDPDQEG